MTRQPPGVPEGMRVKRVSHQWLPTTNYHCELEPDPDYVSPKPKPRVWIVTESSMSERNSMLGFTTVGTGSPTSCRARPLVLDGPEGEELISRLYEAHRHTGGRQGIRAVLEALVRGEA